MTLPQHANSKENAGDVMPVADPEAVSPAEMATPPPSVESMELPEEQQSNSVTERVEARLEIARQRHAEELAEEHRRARQWERDCKVALKEKELATALTGRPIVPGAASQLVTLWRDELEVIDEGDQLRVVTREGKPVADAVSSWLARPEYAHFCRPSSRGGSANPARSTTASSVNRPPRTLGEATLIRWRELSKADPMAPIGLGRPRH